MPRYYFHLQDTVAVNDDEGMELASDAEARLEAIRFGGTMLHDFPDHEHWIVIVKNEAGAKVASLLFSAVPTDETTGTVAT